MPPAARITDMHTCPMVDGVVPHVGGPILPPGEPTVLIGMLPAARMTDMLTCVGPPDSILMGSPTVLIGNLMAARLGDPTDHGGVIVLGEPTVEIGEVGMGSPVVVTPVPPLVILAQAMAASGSAAAQSVSQAAQGLAEGAQSAAPTIVFTLANQPLARAAGSPVSSEDTGAEAEADTIRGVNPGYPSPGRTENCVNCAIATDCTLAGCPASALPGTATPVSKLEEIYGEKFAPVSSHADIESQLIAAGPGARAIIFGSRGPGQVGHVFNAVNQRGTVRFLDGQIGRQASPAGFQKLFMLRTN